MIYLDVDGTLIPFRGRRVQGAPADAGNPLLDRLDPRDGARLLALGGQLVWATTWMAEANEVVAPLLGLPPLPVVEWPEGDEGGRLHWKTVPLTRHAAGRPFVWLDDEITDADRRWVAERYPHPALLRRIDPMVGLAADDFAAVARFSARWTTRPGR
ncbi:HAD domain-containing protein [Paractinoplanes abujensis]|uniref:HAD domain-containing protein n=1 Tax=Paractinoplanes abujensis TaxID=882441 RepID=UPI001614E460|nr:HAD domain-containing protein [Actinoplanes abujensis]